MEHIDQIVCLDVASLRLIKVSKGLRKFMFVNIFGHLAQFLTNLSEEVNVLHRLEVCDSRHGCAILDVNVDVVKLSLVQRRYSLTVELLHAGLHHSD